mmetsp:Transcript_45461/g.46029  ORF Transcript_45461/g.46029 Transcript_45461/m.46029 type:complete len:100 (+) Transcript_45461:955-1254(+)
MLLFFSISTGISKQESIYGTKRLERLQDIKEAVDPNYMFDCNGCIGNSRDTAEDPAVPTQVTADVLVSDEAEGMGDSGASFISFFMTAAAAASITALLV